MSATTPFDPARYLIKLKGKDYLEAKWRLVWLRDRHPDALIHTECLESGDTHARFKAFVAIPGGGEATGHGSETAKDFPDFYEKAETKAIARALAALGFGTQFAPDFDEGERVVDAPVAPRPAKPANTPSPQPRTAANGQPTAAVAATGPDEAATQRQLRYLQAVAREAGVDGAALDERALLEFGAVAAALTRRDASTLIDLLQSGTPPRANGHRADQAEAALRAPDAEELPASAGGDDQPVNGAGINAIWATARQHGIERERVLAAIAREFGLDAEHIGNLTRAQARRVVADLQTAKTP